MTKVFIPCIIIINEIKKMYSYSFNKKYNPNFLYEYSEKMMNSLYTMYVLVL